MQRREFLAASTLAALGLSSAQPAGAASASAQKELIELRVYSFASAEKQKAFEDFFASAMIPALNRAAVSPVGVFKLFKADNEKLKLEADSTDLYVVLSHKSADSFINLRTRLAADAALTKAAEALADAPKDPAYKRIESSVFLGFDQCPQLLSPVKGPDRVLQLRTYESHNEERHLRKVHMFNEGGEIALFRKCGMSPVFFGAALAGCKVPNLTYMLGFENSEAKDKAWKTFISHPEWTALKNNDLYKPDPITTITNLVLRPATGSQI